MMVNQWKLQSCDAARLSNTKEIHLSNFKYMVWYQTRNVRGDHMFRQMKQQFSYQLFVLLLMYKSLEMKFG